jgi:hypothetical protein
MDIKPWPKDPTREIAALADEQKRGLSANDRTMILIYERAMKEAYATRLKYLVEAVNEASAELDDDCPISAARGLRKALADIGELPEL